MFKIESNEDNKVFIDRFRKLVDDVRSIDEAQVPTDLSLMEVKSTKTFHRELSIKITIDVSPIG